MVSPNVTASFLKKTSDITMETASRIPAIRALSIRPRRHSGVRSTSG